jgi:carbon starvation protein
VLITTTASWEKLASSDPRIGLIAAANSLSDKLAAGALPPDKAAVAPQLIFNQQLDALLVLFFVVLLWLIVGDTLRVCTRHLRGKPVPPICETEHIPTRLEEAWVRD